MNELKFQQCLDAYLNYCSTSKWMQDECYKFFFANWLSRKVSLQVQEPGKILGYCKEALKRDYSLRDQVSKLGVQFLQKSGRKKLSRPIELTDIEIIKYLDKNEIPGEEFFKYRE